MLHVTFVGVAVRDDSKSRILIIVDRVVPTEETVAEDPVFLPLIWHETEQTVRRTINNVVLRRNLKPIVLHKDRNSWEILTLVAGHFHDRLLGVHNVAGPRW